MTAHVSPVPRDARPYQGLRAGLVSRTLANAVDVAVVLAILGATYAVVTAARFLLDPISFRFAAPSAPVLIVLGYLVLTAYLALSWWLTGRSYGDHVMGLRVDRRGERLRPVASFARAAFCTIVPIGLLWVAVSRENRSLQDVLLRTSVTYDWQPAAMAGTTAENRVTQRG
jgi:uncharacterized RDD family membrane protein YckC